MKKYNNIVFRENKNKLNNSNNKLLHFNNLILCKPLKIKIKNLNKIDNSLKILFII